MKLSTITLALASTFMFACSDAKPDAPPPEQDAAPFALGTLWTLADGQNSVTSIVVHDDSVYWTTRFGNQVAKCSVDGCSNQPTIIATTDEPMGVAVDSTHVYWASFNGASSAPLDGGPSTSLGYLGSPIAIDNARIYGGGNDAVRSCPLSGCGDAGTFIGAAKDTPLTHLAVDETSVYWADYEGVWTCPLSGCGGQPTALIDGMWDHASGLAVDATNVYASYGMKNMILSCSKNGCGGQPTVFEAFATSPGGLASDGANVYWTNSIGVMRCPITGCGTAPTTLVSLPGGAGGVAVDATSVYFWTNPPAPLQQIMKLSPK
jgi:hypothetical protein